MVEVRVEMDTIVFVHDTLRCRVTIQNTSTLEQTVAWSSAHVHCNCVYAQSRLQILESTPQKRQPTGHANSFSPTRGEKGHCMYETDAAVLCCDLTLGPGETESYDYATNLPHNAPPSYKGENIAYFHKLVIGLQRVGHPAELLRIPLRVLPICAQLASACRRESAIYAARTAGRLESAIGRPSLQDIPSDFDIPDVMTPLQARSMRSSPEAVYRNDEVDNGDITIEMQFDESAGPSSDGNASKNDLQSSNDGADSVSPASSVTPSKKLNESRRDSALLGPREGSVADLRNPFKREQDTSKLTREHVLHAITSLSRRRKPSVFQISTSNSKETVARFSLSKPVFRLGEDVAGWLDFSASTVSCYEVSITLEVEEDIDTQFWRKTDDKTIARSVQAHQKEYCKDLLSVPIILPVPVSSAPQFSTEHVKTNWRMCFEFLMCSKPASISVRRTQPKATMDKVFTVATTVAVDRLNWSLPIQMLPTNPVNLPANQRQTPYLIPVQSSPKHPTFLKARD